MSDASRPKLLIITPVFNEARHVERYASRCTQVMAAELSDYQYEHIFANNASTDETLVILRRLASKDVRTKVIVKSRNVGPFRNAANAMRSATDDAVIPMLAVDLQDPVEVIPEFARQWEVGNLIVYGIRTNRNESIVLRSARRLYYRLLSWSGGGISVPSHSGEFQLLDRGVVNSVLSVDDQYPHIRGLVAQTGAKSTSVTFTWAARSAGGRITVSPNSLIRRSTDV